MAWFPDLSSIDYFPMLVQAPLRPVAWLDAAHDFSTGEVATEHKARLTELLAYPWQPAHFMGWHECEMCIQADLARAEAGSGVSNVFVPSGSVVYVAPEMIVHYIESHQYRPPDEFLTAVYECPPMGSTEYSKALIETGAVGRDPAAVREFEGYFKIFRDLRHSALQRDADPDR